MPLIQSDDSVVTAKARGARPLALVAVLALAFCARASFVVTWHEPYAVHHSDEAFLPFEALALWEGVAPRELGWPAMTSRVGLSAAYAVELAVEHPGSFTHPSGGAVGLLLDVEGWVRQRLTDSDRLFAIARWLSVAVGVLQVWLWSWSGRQWSGARVGLAAAAIAAVVPLAVTHSQFILADMTGVACLTWLVGLLAPGDRPFIPRGVLAGTALGLAVGSKYHFAIWGLPMVAGLWQVGTSRFPWRTTLTGIACSVGVSLGVLLLFVPWLWLNPVLAVKEFTGVVLSKLDAPSGSAAFRAWHNLSYASMHLGWLCLVGLVPAVLFGGRTHLRTFLPVYVGLGLGALAIAVTARLFDRYALLIMVPMVLMSAVGIVQTFERMKERGRLACAALMAVVVIASGRQLQASQAFAGTLDTYGRAHIWLLRHMKPGSRIAVDSEYPAHLPRTDAQLRAIIADIEGPTAYAKKMATNGIHMRPDAQPMRLAVLNDELYTAYWARVELSGDCSNGFDVTYYDDEPRFISLLTPEVVENFKRGLRDPGAGYDALLLNRKLSDPIEPAVVFPGNPGRTFYLYLRDPGNLRVSLEP